MENLNEEIATALDLIDDLLIKAIKIAEEAPYWNYIHNKEWAKIDINANEIIIYCFDDVIDYDSPVLHNYELKLPLNLFFLSDSELSQFQTEQKKIYEETRIKKK